MTRQASRARDNCALATRIAGHVDGAGQRPVSRAVPLRFGAPLPERQKL